MLASRMTPASAASHTSLTPVASLVALASLAAVAAGSGGCLAAGARLQGGVVADGDRVGVQVGASVVLGLTTGRRGAVVGNVGFATGNAPKAGLIDLVEYVRIPDSGAPPVILRTGVGGVINLAGNPGVLGAHAAAVFVVRDRGSSYEGHEKFGGGGWSRSMLGLGVELRAGATTTRIEGATPDDTTSTARPGGSLLATLEWLQLGQTSFF